MLGFENVIEYLKEKTRVSIPELQQHFACGYQEAKEMLQKLIKTYWVVDCVEGVYYPLHTERLHPKTIEKEACRELWETLSDKEMGLLGQLVNRENDLENEDFSRFRESLYEKEKESLLQKGLVHIFAGNLFLSVSKETITYLKEAGEESTEDPVLAEIAYPILVSCIVRQEDVFEIAENPFLPPSCKKYIEEGYAQFCNKKQKPKKMKSEDRLNRNTLKYEVIEAFLTNCKFETKEEYEEEAWRQYEKIRSSPHCSMALKNAVEDACHEIEDDLTLSNIKEIQRIIKDTRED